MREAIGDAIRNHAAEVFVLLNLLMFPLWPIILIATWVSFGSISIDLNLARYVVSLISLGLIAAIKPRRSAMAIVFVIVLIIVGMQFLFDLQTAKFLTSSDFITLWITLLAFMLIIGLPDIFDPPQFNERWIRHATRLAIIVALIGFLEWGLLSNECLASLGYYRLLNIAKGLPMTSTLSGPLPVNIYSFIRGFHYRRMVSIVGEPLYLSYYLYPFVILFIIIIVDRLTLFNIICFLIVTAAMCLALSRQIILVTLLTAIFYLILNQRTRKITIKLSRFLLLPAVPALIFGVKFLWARDASFKGHLIFFIDSLRRIGWGGLLFPDEHTLVGNMLALKYGARFTTESAVLEILSITGLPLFILLISTSLRTLVRDLRTSVDIAHSKEEKYNTIARSLVIAWPFALLGELLTTFFSPQILTLQISFYLIGWSLAFHAARASLKKCTS